MLHVKTAVIFFWLKYVFCLHLQRQTMYYNKLMLSVFSSSFISFLINSVLSNEIYIVCHNAGHFELRYT